jgi:hypothetical protein
MSLVLKPDVPLSSLLADFPLSVLYAIDPT